MQHFDYFIELDNLVKKNLIIYKSEFQVEGAYIHDESEFKLLSEYFAMGKIFIIINTTPSMYSAEYTVCKLYSHVIRKLMKMGTHKCSFGAL